MCRGVITKGEVGGALRALVRGTTAGYRLRSGQRFIHDSTDGTRTSAASGAATKAVIDLAGGPRCSLVARQRRAHVVVGQHVTGADDHNLRKPGSGFVDC